MKHVHVLGRMEPRMNPPTRLSFHFEVNMHLQGTRSNRDSRPYMYTLLRNMIRTSISGVRAVIFEPVAGNLRQP